MNLKVIESSSVRWILMVLILILLAFVSGCATTKPGETLTDKSLSSALSKRISTITTSDTPGETTVTIKGSDNLVYTSVKQPFPLGVVLYFPETVIDTPNTVVSNIPAGSPIISSIETTGIPQKGSASKVSILLKKDVPYEVVQDKSFLRVVFYKKKEGPVNQGIVQAEPKKQSVGANVQKEKKQSRALNQVQRKDMPATEKRDRISQYSKPAWVNRIDFSSEKSGKSTVIIATTRPVEYNIQKVSNNIIKLRLYRTNLTEYRQRQLITTRFESAVDRIIPIQTPEMKYDSIISIELRESVAYYIEQNEEIIKIHFEASKIPPRPLESVDLPPWKKIIEQTVTKPEIDAEGLETPEEGPAIRSTDQYFEKKVYSGEKIALDFYETDVKNVFRILREISGKNFIIDDDVTGKVTMTLDQPVPWDQILDLVLKMNQLGLVYEGDIIRIATLATIKRESEALMESISAEREAKEKIKDLAPLLTEYISISYSNAKDEILPHLKNIITEGRGNISVDERNNQVIITDTAEKIMQAREIVKNIDKVTPQVIIEAKIVEINKNVAKDIGIDWTAEGGIQGTDPRAGVGPQRGFDILGGTYGWNSAMNFPVEGGGQIGFNFTRISGTPFVLNATLTALETTGDVKIISAPKIVTLDNKKAMIKQGFEVGYFDSEQTDSLEQGRTVEFKEVDLLLEVTPHVTPDNRVSMSIFITKNDVDSLIDGIPTIATNEAETELLVNDGDTIVIGGIMKTTLSEGETGFPGLSKVPGLGRLFRRDSKSERNNELLIFITPRIVLLEQRMM